MKVFIIVLFLIQIIIISGTKPRLWTRIPQFFVSERVNNFINSNGITNCFEFQETSTNLLLKCWRDNKLVDVSIDIKNKYKNNNRYITTISI